MPRLRSRHKSLKNKSIRKSSKRKSRKRVSRRKSSKRKSSKRKSRRKSSKRKSRRKSSKRKSISAKRNKRKGFKPPTKGWYIITKEGCPYCKDAKNLLDSKGEKYKSINITVSNRDKIYRDLDILTKTYRYVPMVFKDRKFIGGFSELKTYI